MKALLLWHGLTTGAVICIPLLDNTAQDAIRASFSYGVALLAAYFMGFR